MGHIPLHSALKTDLRFPGGLIHAARGWFVFLRISGVARVAGSAPTLFLIGLLTLSDPAAHASDAPQRVVSMNLCTDQLAMMVAAPGQLHSVSHLARDPRESAMAEEAKAYLTNHELAEEIYLMQPDLVVTSSFSTRATVQMLQRLGIPVVLFEPAQSLDEVRDRLRQMGEVLGRQDAAEEIIADFDRRLAALASETDNRPSAALYYANGYTAGDRSLAGQILLAAGFENAAAEAGLVSGGVLPLELLALLDPDAVISGRRYPAGSRAEAILDHPVVARLRSESALGTVTDRDWMCGTPHVLGAIEKLGALRTELQGD